MTTVAWDGKMLATDSQTTISGHRRGSDICKLFFVEGHMIALAGCPCRGQQFLDWFEETAHGGSPSNPFGKDDDEAFSAVVIDPKGKCWEYDVHLSPIAILGSDAWGSGAPFASALMAAGKTAKEAVEIICRKRLDAFTGGKVQWAQVERRDKK